MGNGDLNISHPLGKSAGRANVVRSWNKQAGAEEERSENSCQQMQRQGNILSR